MLQQSDGIQAPLRLQLHHGRHERGEQLSLLPIESRQPLLPCQIRPPDLRALDEAARVKVFPHDLRIPPLEERPGEGAEEVDDLG